MEIDLRQAIVNRVQGKNEDELSEIIEGSIHTEDMALPGLGVLFEMIWQNSTEAARKKMISVLRKQLPPTQA
ncbi:small acid-soluble spore protein SspI [Cohnella terricola]|uniref:Small, acid-soluble spore protein I n=1 Tax=Cohnella terricola TaxID=1289167 RepID=A0A559JFG3_9BACL|nr:small acid-soluble spore protein SspI [Cohnella terricola]TVX98621.1 small acid-soluble spore protein SspI [Cohnella terricola]